MRIIYARIYPPHQVLLIYDKFSPKSLIHKMEERKDKYRDRYDSAFSRYRLDQGEIPKHQAIMIGDLPAHERNIFSEILLLRKISAATVSREDIGYHDHVIRRFICLIHRFCCSATAGLTVEKLKVIKRIFDVPVSGLMLIVLSPLMLIIALLVHFYDGGPVFYKQERLTRKNRSGISRL